MPRKKASRKLETENRLSGKLEELDMIHKKFVENAELEYENNLLAISNAISICKTKTPSHILEMTMGELKKMSVGTLAEASEIYLKQQDVNEDIALSMRSKTSTIERKRKSRSASNCKKRMQSGGEASSEDVRVPRSRERAKFAVYRSASVEVIRPKVSNTPGSILRHARVNEIVYSIKGSPVLTDKAVGKSPSINIPTKNGILAMRPNKLNVNDKKEIQQIDNNTLKQLKKLHENLKNIIEIGNRK